MYAENPSGENAFTLAGMYIPFQGGDPSRADPAKAIRLLEESVSKHDNRGRMFLMKLKLQHPNAHENQPTITELLKDASKRVYEFKKNAFRTAVLNLFPSLSSSSSTSPSPIPGINREPSHLDFLVTEELPFTDGYPTHDIFSLSAEDALDLIVPFHHQRMQGKYPVDLLEYPWTMPETSSLFASSVMHRLEPLYVGLMVDTNLQRICDIIRTCQPHGAVVALYLLEWPWFAREMNPLESQPSVLVEATYRLARQESVVHTLLETLCDPRESGEAVSVYVANSIVHLLGAIAQAPRSVLFQVENYETRLLHGVLQVLLFNRC